MKPRKLHTIMINADWYIGGLQSTLAAEIAALRNSLRAIEDGSFLERAMIPRPDAVLKFQVDVTASRAEPARAAACNRCFLGLVRALIAFIDRMLALQEFTRHPAALAGHIATIEDLRRFIAERIDETYRRFAADTRLRNPSKLDMFQGLGDFAKKASLSYFALRRSLEHHGGVPREDVTVHFLKHTLLAGDQEIARLPFQAEAGTQIRVRADEVSRAFLPGEKAALSEADVEAIFFTIQTLVAPSIVRTLVPPRSSPSDNSGGE